MPNDNNKKITILMADDDVDDYYILKEALEERKIDGNLRLVSDGVELMDYLLCRGRFMAQDEAPTPSVILLDLNMPKKDGREALIEIKAHTVLRKIPVIIYTTSGDKKDIDECYGAGANSYIIKPVTFEGLLETVDSLMNYWFNIAKLPGESTASRIVSRSILPA